MPQVGESDFLVGSEYNHSFSQLLLIFKGKGEDKIIHFKKFKKPFIDNN